MSLQVHLQLLTPVWHNLSIIRSRKTFVCLVIIWGNTSYDGNGTGNRHGHRNGNGKRNLQYTRLRPEHAYTFVRTRYLLRLSVPYVRTYALSSPSVCPYTSLTYGVSFTSQHRINNMSFRYSHLSKRSRVPFLIVMPLYIVLFGSAYTSKFSFEW